MKSRNKKLENRSKNKGIFIIFISWKQIKVVKTKIFFKNKKQNKDKNDESKTTIVVSTPYTFRNEFSFKLMICK